jgi:hypothetical protein
MQADRRLREMQRLRCRRKGAKVDDGDQSTQLIEVQLSHQKS